MNILIDIPNINKKNGGVYQYSEALIKILAKGLLPHKFFILCHCPSKEIQDVVNTTRNFELVNSQPAIHLKVKRLWTKIVRKFFKIIRREIPQKDLYDSIIAKYNIDIIHTPYQNLVKKKHVKSITTLHDVQELHFPGFFDSATRAQRAVSYKKAIDGADAVIVSYDHIKGDIEKFFNKPEAMVHTVLLDMQDLWFSNIAFINENVTEKFSLPSEFLLYPAATWEHKNHLKLFEAVKILNNDEIFLVCTGHQTEFFNQRIKPTIEEFGLNPNVRFLGIVTNEDLLGLYKSCRGVVIPTLYEAGSFPLMESILLKVPVICSDVTSLPETIGDDKFVFDPYDIEDIAEKINRIWCDMNYREENISLSEKQALKLKYNKAAFKINAIYENIVKQKK